MEEKRIQATSDKKSELESLIKEQADARKIFRKRESLGDLTRHLEFMSKLAQSILERHDRILKLQNEIELESTDLNKNDNQLMETFDNPILKWLQKEINRLERIIENLQRHAKSKQNKQYYISPEELDKYKLIADRASKKEEKGWKLSPEEEAIQRKYQGDEAARHNINDNIKKVPSQDGAKGIGE